MLDMSQVATLALNFLGGMVQTQYFNVTPSQAVNGNVILVQNQFSCAKNSASPAQSRMVL